MGQKEQHTLGGLVLRQENSKLGEDTHVSTFQAQTSLKQADDLLKVTAALVKLDKSRKFFSMDDDIETANLGEAELSLLDTSSMDLLPHPTKESAGGRPQEIKSTNCVLPAFLALSTAAWFSSR